MARQRKNLVDDIRSYCPDHILSFVERHPPKRRGEVICQFMRTAHQLDPKWYAKSGVITSACRKFLSDRRQQIPPGMDKPVKEVTVISDYGSVSHYLSKLIQAKKLPSNTLIPPNPKSSDVFSEKECNILGHLNLADAVQAPSMEIALEQIARQIEVHRKVIIDECKRIVIKGYEEFCKTPEMIRNSDIEAILQTQDNLDPNAEAFNGQNLSFFSKAHENGFINTVAYIHQAHGGLFTRDAFPGSHHAYSWSTTKIRQQLGITEKFSVAAACIIIDELGINVQDLFKAKVKRTKDGQYVTIREDGGVSITTFKPRANALKERFAPKTIEIEDATEDNLDANTVLCMLLEMREQHSRTLNSNYLFIVDSSSQVRTGDSELYRVLDMRRKTAFKKIIASLPSWVADAEPTMPKIRVSRGLLIWLEKGGDALATSIYLGNSLITALRNYIPPEIQEFVHRKKIRDHQNILLLLSDGSSPPQSETDGAYAAAKTQLKDIVKRLNKANHAKPSEEDDNVVIFLCSPINIELLISYIEYGRDNELIDTCRSIVTKIEDEGSRKMIKMLANACVKKIDFNFMEETLNEKA